MRKKRTKNTMRFRAYRGVSERKLATEVLRGYNGLVGQRLQIILEEMKAMGYVVGCKCDYAPHELDLFRRKMSVPFFFYNGRRTRIFHRNPLQKGCWINIFLAEQEATRDPDAEDAPERLALFERIMNELIVHQSPMFYKLGENREIFKDLHTISEQYVVIEQETLPFDEAEGA